MKKQIIRLVVLFSLILIFINGCGTISSEKLNKDNEEGYKITIAEVETESNEIVQDETEEIPLEIKDLSCKYGDYGWIYAKGRVQNLGNKEAGYVKVNIDLYNEEQWVDSDFTYIRNVNLPAGSIDSFEYTWVDDSIIFTRCEAFVTYSNYLY